MSTVRIAPKKFGQKYENLHIIFLLEINRTFFFTPNILKLNEDLS